MNYGHVYIESGATTSGEIVVGGNATVLGIKLPSAMTNTSIKVQGKYFESDSWDDVYYNGILVSVPATASTKQKFVPASMVGLYSVRFVATGVGNEAAQRQIFFAYDGIL